MPVILKQLVEREMEKQRRLAKGEFIGYVMMFPQHERLRRFLEIEHRLTDRKYWSLLGLLWSLEEIFLPNLPVWERLLASKRKFRSLMMSSEERKQLNAMPDSVRVYRGFCHRDGLFGYSWTLKKSEAKKFSEYANGPRRRLFGARKFEGRFVASGVVKKADIIAFFDERKESEIVVPYTSVHITKVEHNRHPKLPWVSLRLVR